MHERELRRALDGHEFRLEFQPMVRASNGGVVGAEALLRWDHPILGLLRPATFLPVAERSGLIAPIGEWVVSEAIAERATWPDDTFVSVNLSPAELASASTRGLVRRIERSCDDRHVDPSSLWIEVTEQPITAPEATAATLRVLSDLGVKVVLDDLGSGHASITRLRELPFDICKLDRSFVAGMDERGGTRALRAAIDLARAFGTTVVAEGIETAAQLERIDPLGCDLLQGYLLGRPVSPERIRERFELRQRAAPRPIEVRPVESTDLGTSATADRDHRVLYYDDDQALAVWVVDALATALDAGDNAVVVVTEEHRRSITAGLTDRGVDVAGALRSGRLLLHDAATVLDRLLGGGASVTDQLAGLLTAVLPAEGSRLWAFQELVAVLWEQGDVATAMSLEDAWNTVCAGGATTIMCAYPSVGIGRDAHGDGLERIAQHHSHVTVAGCPLDVDPAAIRRDPTRHVQELRSVIAATVQAVGARAHLEADLLELQQRVDASSGFGAMVVHEIRNPVSVLTLALDALRAELGGPGSELQHLLDMATTSVRTIARFSEELLESARLEATQFAVRREPFDLAQVVTEAVEQTGLASGRDVTCDLPASLPAAVGDRDRLRQVLLNLLDNAVACSPVDTSVQVTCSIEQDRLVVRVADAGPGIPPEDRPRLFEPFARPTTSPRIGGAGLGLHIVDRLVRAQHGDVWVEDAATGGAVFAVTVPRDRCPGSASEPHSVTEVLSARAS